MLTARDVQELLQIDRSTVYRMADAGKLPAIKVGKQWRFPADRFHNWFQIQVAPKTTQANYSLPLPPVSPGQPRNLDELLSWEWLRIFLDSFADLLGVMIVVTDIKGQPLDHPARPCGLFASVRQQPGAMDNFIEGWRGLAAAVDLTPTFRANSLDLLYARSMIAVGTELKGMVIGGGVAPTSWPPSPSAINTTADRFAISPELFHQHAHEVYVLDEAQKARVLATLPKIATLIAHIVDERMLLIDRLEAIASLTSISRQ